MSVNLYNATTDTLKNVAGDIVNPKSVNEMIAPTEETTTASRAYNIGEQFFLNDVLYKATANIAQGDTITVGTNCSASDKLTEQIDNKQNTITTNYYSRNITTSTNYIGVFSITIPSHTAAIIHAIAGHRNHQPSCIGIHDSASFTSYAAGVWNADSDVCAVDTSIVNASSNSNKSISVFVKYATSGGSEMVECYAIFIPIV